MVFRNVLISTIFVCSSLFGMNVFANFQQVPPERIKSLMEEADQGVSQSQYLLGYAYFTGSSVPRDLNLSMYWHQKAADQGHMMSQFNLGLFYGSSPLNDYTASAKWYRKAANQGHSGSQHSLGDYYFFGRGVPKDINQAKKWYRKAANQGHPIAIGKLRALQ
ncbi:tetratricopeptide repeat protein [Acinetobacter sp. ULE_I092]|jgi:hypothetical protein|uniref:tetratricopeptide repeat protein n=1 Tax=Acinetobacter sp. ULE_I092 TaxID=3373075 RepID=UPI003AF767C6